MLQNRIYRGEIVHKGKSYPGEHEAIVDETLWNEVQAILAENRVDRINGTAGQRAKPVDRDSIRCPRRPDEPDACEQEGDPLSLLHLAVTAGRIDEGQKRRPANPSRCA